MTKLILIALLCFSIGCNVKIEPTSNANIAVSQNGNSVDIKVQQSNSNTTVSNSQPSEKKPENAANKPKEVAEKSSGGTKTVKIYLDCGGETNMVNYDRTIENTPGVLRASLEELIRAEPDNENCINWTLGTTLVDVSIEDKKAIVLLRGMSDEYSKNGWSEDRCHLELWQQVATTAEQFPTVKDTIVFLNGKECSASNFER